MQQKIWLQDLSTKNYCKKESGLTALLTRKMISQQISRVVFIEFDLTVTNTIHWTYGCYL